MDQVAIDYLLRLAGFALTFVGFATIVVTLRRTAGAELAPFDRLLVRYYIENGLLTAAAALLPSLLIMYGVSFPSAWRIASGIVGIVAPAYFADYVIRRRRIVPGPFPARIFVRGAISAVIFVLLWLNAAGVTFQPNGAPYALALTWFLISAGIVFLQTLDPVLGGKPTS